MVKFIKFGLSFIALLLVFSMYGGGKQAEASELELTQEKKEELYKQYVEILAEVSAQYPNEEISISPLDNFNDEDFMEPEDYREFVVNLATSYIVVEPAKSGGITLFATGSATRKFNIAFGDSTTREIAVTGSFIIDNFLGRMGFAGINSISSRATENRGTWTQKAYNGRIMDAGETYNISLSGSYVENKTTKTYNTSLDFYCSGTGNVS